MTPVDALKPVARKRTVSKLKDAHIQRVIETTKQLMASEGIESITIRGLAKASGVAPATLYNRFVNKETLISIVVVDHYEREVREGFTGGADAGSPMEGFLGGLELLARTCHESPAFVRAVVGMYYSVGGNRNMPETMYKTLGNTLTELLDQMAQQGALKDWVCVDATCAEICERCFSVVHRWVIDDIPGQSLVNHLNFGALSILIGVSQAAQAQQIEAMLQQILREPGFRSRVEQGAQVPPCH